MDPVVILSDFPLVAQDETDIDSASTHAVANSLENRALLETRAVMVGSLRLRRAATILRVPHMAWGGAFLHQAIIC
jgi:hypothetical protein